MGDWEFPPRHDIARRETAAGHADNAGDKTTRKPPGIDLCPRSTKGLHFARIARPGCLEKIQSCHGSHVVSLMYSTLCARRNISQAKHQSTIVTAIVEGA